MMGISITSESVEGCRPISCVSLVARPRNSSFVRDVSRSTVIDDPPAVVGWAFALSVWSYRANAGADASISVDPQQRGMGHVHSEVGSQAPCSWRWQGEEHRGMYFSCRPRRDPETSHLHELGVLCRCISAAASLFGLVASFIGWRHGNMQAPEPEHESDPSVGIPPRGDGQ
ncbi:hypothetical protein VUR80DRAFT_3914 [Thermomyces stellatus]